MKLETNLLCLAEAETEKEEENLAFKDLLRRGDPVEIDTLVQTLNSEVAPKIDCTQCGNCCKSLMINVTSAEVKILSGHLGMRGEDFENRFVEKGMGEMMIMNKIPCHFLSDNKCTVYEHRFAECRNFPGLHNPVFTQRLFATFMHYGRCPIIYNVIEQLKIKTGFLQTAADE